jgi:VWFA-related protein
MARRIASLKASGRRFIGLTSAMSAFALFVGLQVSFQAQSTGPSTQSGQTSGKPTENRGALRPTFKADTREVSVVFRVVDKKNQLVPGISQNEIHIDDEGVPRSITSFSADVAHAQVVVLADVSGSMGSMLEPLQGALFTFADIVSQDYNREPGDVLLSLVPFSDTATLLVDRTSNPVEFKSAVKRLRSTGSTALVDTVLATLLNAFGDKNAPVTEKVPQRRSHQDDTEDNLAPIPSEFRPERPSLQVAGTKRSKFLVICTDAGENASAHQWLDITSAMLGKDVVIYSIAFDSGTPDANMSMLSKITVQSGGKVYKAKVDDLQRVYTQIAQDIRSHYQLTFAANDVASTRKWRKIAVMTTRPGVAIFARSGYCPETPCQKEDGSFVGGQPRNWNEVLALSRDPAVIFSVRQRLQGLKFEYNSETERIVGDLASDPLLIERVWGANRKHGGDSDKPAFVVHKLENGNQLVNIDAEVCGIKLEPEAISSPHANVKSEPFSSLTKEPELRVVDPEIRLARRPGSGRLEPQAVSQDAYFQSQALFYLKDPSGRIPSRIRVQCNRPHFLIDEDLVQFAVQALEHGLKVKSTTTQESTRMVEFAKQ